MKLVGFTGARTSPSACGTYRPRLRIHLARLSSQTKTGCVCISGRFCGRGRPRSKKPDKQTGTSTGTAWKPLALKVSGVGSVALSFLRDSTSSRPSNSLASHLVPRGRGRRDPKNRTYTLARVGDSLCFVYPLRDNHTRSFRHIPLTLLGGQFFNCIAQHCSRHPFGIRVQEGKQRLHVFASHFA